MATLAQIQAAMTGFPRTLTWNNYPQRQTSPSPPMQALTSARWAMSGWNVAVVNGEYRVTGIRITVSLNTQASWAVPAAVSSASLLVHEQGHYDITGLIARDLTGKILDLSLDVAVVAAMRGAGSTPQQQRNYALQQFQNSINAYAQAANALSDRLQTNPVTHADGIYDVQTNHSMNTAVQAAWNTRLAGIKSSGASFELMLAAEGII
jgi:hypothetical protein